MTLIVVIDHFNFTLLFVPAHEQVESHPSSLEKEINDKTLPQADRLHKPGAS